ncbi:MAG: type IV pilus modification protein PilV [Alishewanella aestuarii]
MKQKNRNSYKSQTTQRGVTLLEVMIAVFVLGIGLLGVAALQGASVRHTNNALERTMAVILTETLSELLRANPQLARQGSFAFSDCTGSTELGTHGWVLDVKQATRADTCPVVTWQDGTYLVSIVWGDERTGVESRVITEIMP